MSTVQAEWHTEGRRQPEIIGRDPAGRRLWGGPYTFHQFGLMAIVGLVGWIVSAPLGASVRVGITGGLVLAAYFVGKQVDLSKGNPVFWLTGSARLVAHALLRPQGLSGIPSSASTMRRPSTTHMTIHPFLVAETSTVAAPLPTPGLIADDSEEALQVEEQQEPTEDPAPVLSNPAAAGAPSALAQFLAAANRRPTP